MTDWSDRSDVELMVGVANDEDAALGCLVDRFSGPVVALCRRIIHDTGEADDVAADVFVELWNRRQRYDSSRGTPRTYILMLTRSRCLDRLRVLATRPRRQLADNTVCEELLVDQRRSPAESVALTDLAAIVKASLETLPAPQRRTLELSFFEDLSHRQISERLEMPLGSVKTYIRNGLKTLRFALKSAVHVKD